MATFGIAGAVAAIAGVLAASRTLGVGVFSGGGVGGGTLLLESIAAAVIGGVEALFGGRGSVRGTAGRPGDRHGPERPEPDGRRERDRLIVTGLLLVLAWSPLTS